MLLTPAEPVSGMSANHPLTDQNSVPVKPIASSHPYCSDCPHLTWMSSSFKSNPLELRRSSWSRSSATNVIGNAPTAKNRCWKSLSHTKNSRCPHLTASHTASVNPLSCFGLHKSLELLWSAPRLPKGSTDGHVQALRFCGDPVT